MPHADHKKISRGISRDMSPEAISRRLRIVSELRTLCLKLGKAEKVTPEIKNQNEKKRVGSDAENNGNNP